MFKMTFVYDFMTVTPSGRMNCDLSTGIKVELVVYGPGSAARPFSSHACKLCTQAKLPHLELWAKTSFVIRSTTEMAGIMRSYL